MTCENCTRSWDEHEGIIDDNCPFCNHKLICEPDIAIDTPFDIINTNTTEILMKALNLNHY